MPANSIDDRETCEDEAAAGVQPLPCGVDVGGDVLLRGRRCRLERSIAHHDCREMHLSAGGHTQRILLWPFDRPAAITRLRRTRVVPLRAWRRALARAAAAAMEPVTPRAEPRTVEIVPYQLAPVLAVAGGVSRLLLADEVGLGKTIQAGWIVAEIVARHPGARLLLAVPAGIRRQWIEELSARFGIDAAAVDARWLRGMVASLPADVSPWTPPGVYVASLDFLKRPDVASSAAAHIWDLLVVDEAHTATAPTERHAALAAVALRARRVVAITATPYTGNPSSFASLASLGSTGDDPPPLMFRRSREDVGDPRRRRHRFASVRISRAESRIQRLLERYSRTVWDEAAADGARLAVTILRKRALSSPAAAARSLRRRRDLLSSRAPVPRQLDLFEDEHVDDEMPLAALAAPGLADASVEQRWLELLIEAADAAGERESKLLFLQRLLRRVKGESVLVFTEYRDTLLQLAARLPPSLQLHGGLSAAERADVQRRFNREGGLLLATDAAAEGLNLHGRCRCVVNYELPWNPGRLEQRIGRVDRIGQNRAVHALTLTARDTAEDLVIKNLARRLARVVGALGPADRLGAFLDETRTARIVIGGAPLDESALPDVDAAQVRRIPDDVRAAQSAAGQLRARAAAAAGPLISTGEVLVSSVRASRTLPPGFMVVVYCSAQAADGAAIARMVLVAHVPALLEKPDSARAARSLADDLLRALPDVPKLSPDLERWFAAACAAHDGLVTSAVHREAFLRSRRSNGVVIQPGLFDRRAIVSAAAEQQADASLAGECQRHMEMLERSRPLRLICEPAAVLIAWR